MSRCSVGGRTRIYSKSQCLSKQLYKYRTVSIGFCFSTDDFVYALADGVPGVRDVTDAVPRHGAELNHHEHQRQHVLLPPEGRAEGEHEGDHHDHSGHHPRLGEHAGQLLDRAH